MLLGESQSGGWRVDNVGKRCFKQATGIRSHSSERTVLFFMGLMAAAKGRKGMLDLL